jgi:hypothetical protein
VRLSEARVSITRRETIAARRPALPGCRRAAPDPRPARTPAITFPLASAIPGNGLRSRCSSTGCAAGQSGLSQPSSVKDHREVLDARHLSEGRPPNVMRRCSRIHSRPALCRTVPGRIGCSDAEVIAERSHPARIADEHSFRGDREWGQEWGRRQGLRWPSTGVKMPTSGPGIPGRQGFSRASSPWQHCCGPGCRGFESPRSPQ